MASVNSYASNIEYTAGTNFQSSSNICKSWDDLTNLKTAGGVAQCRNPNNTSTPTIAGRNGTYKKPAPLDFTGFSFDTSNMHTVDKVIVHYTHGKFINNGYYPEFGGATITLLNTNTDSKIGTAVPAAADLNSGTSYTVEFTGITVNQLSNIGLRIAYPSNTSTTPGRIFLKDVYLEVVYNENISVILSGKFNKSPVMVDDTSTVTITAKKTGTYEYDSNIQITLPEGLEFVSGDLNTISVVQGLSNNQVVNWHPHFVAANNTSETISFTVRALTTGQKQITVKETVLGTTYSFSQQVNKVTHIVWTDITQRRLALTEDREAVFHVDIRGDNTTVQSTTISIDVTGINSIDYANLLTHPKITLLRYENKRFTITFDLPVNEVVRFTFQRCIWNTPDTYTLRVQVNNETAINYAYVVNPRVMGDLSFTWYKLPDYYKEDMGDGISYTAGCRGKLLFNSDDYEIIDGGDNLRIGIYNGSKEDMYENYTAGVDEETLTLDEETFLSQVQWSNTIADTTGVDQSVSFEFNENNPVIFVYSYTYVNDPLTQVCKYNFTEPYLVESSIYDTTAANGYRAIVPHPPKALLGDTKWAVCTIPTFNEAVPVAVDKWLDGGILDDKIAIHGLILQFDYVVDNKILIEVELLHGEKTGVRTLLLNKGKGTATIGNAYDLFDFEIGDFIEDTKNFEIRIKEVNNFNKEVKPQIQNARLIVYYVPISKCQYGFSIDGQRSEWYGIYLTPGFEPHMSTKHDKSEYHVEGTDETIVNRLNVDPKQLEFEIKVPGCVLDETIPQVDKIVDLFTNERELYSNKPIPKHIIFDIMPDRQYEFVRIDEFDDEFEGTTYKAKIKLYIPMGTSYNVESTITGGDGYNPSNTTVKPVVTARCDNAGEVTVTESYMNQYMHVKSTSIKVGDMVVFDCIEHVVYKYTGDSMDVSNTTDLTTSLDYNSSWFKIKGRYSFTGVGSTVMTVEYNPRR